MVYLADHPALCVLEVRVHLDLPLDMLPADYMLLRVDLGDAGIEAVARMPDATRALGDSWLAGASTPLLRVPSVLVPHGWTILLNPAHPDAAAARIAETIAYRFDRRLWA